MQRNPLKPTILKQGDVRSDGFIFFGYKKNPNNPGQFYEWFLSPKVYHKKRMRMKELSQLAQKRHYIDPITGPIIREKSMLAMRKNRLLRPATFMCVSARCKSKRLGIPFNLVPDDIIIPKKCPALGIELLVNKNRVGPNSPTLDRIHPNLGYVKGNVIVISHKANAIKSNATAVEILKVAKFVAGLNDNHS